MGWSVGHIDGGRVEVTGVATILVHPGVARDAANTIDMDWRGGRNDKLAAPDTISLASIGALGIDSKTLAATCSSTNGSASLSSFSSSILNEIPVHTVPSGTLTTSGTAATFSTDVRGKLHVGDLVGSSTTYGYSRLTAIGADGLSGTLVAALPGGDATTIAYSRIEQPTIKAGSETARQVNTITAAGTTVVQSGNAGATNSGLAVQVGIEVASIMLSVHKVYLFTPGTGYSYSSIASTQRTTLLSSALGTATVVARRHLATFYNNSSGDLWKVGCSGEGVIKRFYFREANGFGTSLLVNNGAPNATWTNVDATGLAPPDAVALIATVDNEGVAGKTLYAKPADGVAWATQAGSNDFTIGDGNSSLRDVDVNRNQAFAYSFQTSSGSAYIYLHGWVADLTLWQ